MVLLKPLVLILTLNVVGLEGLRCPKGHSAIREHRVWSCKPCSEGSYQPKDNNSGDCSPCVKCDGKAGSETKQNCTSETNTICQCREGFVTWDDENSICKCDIGFGVNSNNPSPQQQCSKCEEGYFTTGINQQCKKWKICTSAGVKINGTATSDVICNDELKSDSTVTATPPTPNESVSFTDVASRYPHDGARTLNMLTGRATTGAPPRKAKDHHSHLPNTGSHGGWTFVLLGVAGLLVILTAVTCALHVVPRQQRKTTGNLQTKDSTCRRPVEESGDDSELSLKQNAEEP